MAVTEEQIIEVLRPVEDPELHRSIVDLGMVKSITILDTDVTVQIALTIAGCPLRNEIDTRVKGAIHALDGVATSAVDFTVMTDEERAKVRELVHGDPAATAGSQAAHGHAEGRAIPFADPKSKTRALIPGGPQVGSGLGVFGPLSGMGGSLMYA